MRELFAAKPRALGISREDAEQVLPDDGFAPRHGRRQERVARRDDAQVAIQDEREDRRCFEQPAVIERLHSHQRVQ